MTKFKTLAVVKRFKPSDFDEYQERTDDTAIYPIIGHGVVYPSLGLTNEAGEFAGKIKKRFRDHGGNFGDTEDLKSELGDCLYYLARCATELGLSLDEIAKYNLEKLRKRKEKNTLQGEGDDR